MCCMKRFVFSYMCVVYEKICIELYVCVVWKDLYLVTCLCCMKRFVFSYMFVLYEKIYI